MRILMLIDRMENGGAETHVLTLASGLAARGHAVCVASGGGTLLRELEVNGVRHICLPLYSRAPHAILYSRAHLKFLLKRGKFDIVHSHSRLASLLCEDIARKYKVPFFVTAHARFKTSPLRRRLSRWGRSPIAVSEDLCQYLSEEYGILPSLIKVIPNGVDTERFCPRENILRGKTVLFLSRLDRDCSLGAKLLCEIAPRLYALDSEIRIKIGGAGDDFSVVLALAERINSRIGCKMIECVGRVLDGESFLRSGEVFVGVSRAAIEAGMCGLSVVLCGNEGYFGRLTEYNFTRAMNSNFCARGCPPIKCDRLFSDICASLADHKSDALRELFLKYCSAERCVSATEKHYLSNIIRNSARGTSLLCGYYGYSNIGDDALMLASVERAKREFRESEVRVLTRRGARDSRSFCIACAHRYSLFTLVRELRKCDRLIFGGGTLLQNDTSCRSLFYYCFLIFLARALGKECVMWGSGIGHIRGRFCRALCRRALMVCSSIEARDLRSYAIAKRAIGTRAIFARDMCEGEWLGASRRTRAEFLLDRLFGKNVPHFSVFAIKGDPPPALRLEIARLIAYERERGNEILFVVMCEREDRQASEEWADIVDGVLLTRVDFSDLCGIFEHAERVYSMRLHALIAAKVAKRPLIAIGNEPKIIEFCRECGENS